MKLWKNDPPAIRTAKFIRLFAALVVLVAAPIFVGMGGWAQHKLDNYQHRQAIVFDQAKVHVSEGTWGSHDEYSVNVRLQGEPAQSRRLQVDEATFDRYGTASEYNPAECELLISPDGQEWELTDDAVQGVSNSRKGGAYIAGMALALMLFMTWQIHSARKHLAAKKNAHAEPPPPRAYTPYGSIPPGR